MKLESGLDIVYSEIFQTAHGLSSSASLEVVTGYMLKDIYGFDVTKSGYGTYRSVFREQLQRL